MGFEQPVPGALRPAGKKCPGGAFLGRGRIRAPAPKAAPYGVLLFIFAAKDYSINESLFHRQSQSTTAENSVTGQRYIHHREKGNRM